MKKIIILLVTTLTIFGCSKDESSEKNNNPNPIYLDDNIIGKTTSGNYSFNYNKNLSFGYVNSEFSNKELINKIGFGCVSLTDASSKRKAVKRLRLVHELGVNWFDTAPLYGKGYSEKILGSFLSELPSFERDKVQVVTKFGLGHEKHVNLPVDLALILSV